MKAYFLILITALFTLGACNEDSDDEEQPVSQNQDTDSDDGDKGNSLPNTYLIIEGDTFYETTSSAQPILPNQPYRHQVNFGTRKQLAETPDEVGQNSTLGMVMTFAEKPSKAMNVNLVSKRFGVEADELNLYISFFVNTGDAREGKNYLSNDGVALSLDIADAKLTAKIPETKISDEADAEQMLTINGGQLDLKW